MDNIMNKYEEEALKDLTRYLRVPIPEKPEIRTETEEE